MFERRSTKPCHARGAPQGIDHEGGNPHRRELARVGESRAPIGRRWSHAGARPPAFAGRRRLEERRDGRCWNATVGIGHVGRRERAETGKLTAARPWMRARASPSGPGLRESRHRAGDQRREEGAGESKCAGKPGVMSVAANDSGTAARRRHQRKLSEGPWCRWRSLVSDNPLAIGTGKRREPLLRPHGLRRASCFASMSSANPAKRAARSGVACRAVARASIEPAFALRASAWHPSLRCAREAGWPAEP